jgi:uncharacterized caspase-like protein
MKTFKNLPCAGRQGPGCGARQLLAVAVLMAVGFGSATSVVAQPGGGHAKCRSWALLIGVEKYHRVATLRYTVNDVRQLATTLRNRAGFSEENVLEITDEAGTPRYQPLKASIEAELPVWLKQPGPDDSIIVYFSGHGFRDAAGKMYLAPIDCNPDDLVKSAIPVEWFRQQLAECKAHFKLLVLDSCHAGSEKGESDGKSLSAKDIGEPFRDLEGVVTLASSMANEKSQIWEEKQQSLFSYWLNQGLRGHADDNNDNAVDIDELYKYVYRNVTRTAKLTQPLAQTPVRIVRSGTPDVPVVANLQPLTLRQVIADTAEQMADAIEARKLKKVGVLEFINDTKLGELLGADFGLLGRYCAEELERKLADFGEGKFIVVDRRRLQTAIGEQGLKLKDIGSAEAMRQLSARADGMPVIALGTLRNRAGRIVNIRCKLVRTDSDDLVGSAGGSAVLNESEWAMLGRSAAVKPGDFRPEVSPPGKSNSPEEYRIHELDRASDGSHPLSDPRFAYRLRLMIGGQERKGVFRGNDYFVPVRKGEIYEIWVENRSGQTVLLRLLVDGLNTLLELEGTKGIKTYVAAKRVNLDEARHWELDPAISTVFAIRGFATDESAQGKLREFVVVDAEASLAARQKFSDQVGLITAAFYAPSGGARSVGTGFGRDRNEKYIEGQDIKPGNLLSVVHIRYVEADALDKTPRP